MAQPHRIRLQGPWQIVPPGTDHSTTPFIDVKQVASWLDLFGGTGGLARFVRAFNSPTNLQAEDRILLRLPEGAGIVHECRINGRLITRVSNDEWAYDLTAHLLPFNQIDLLIEFHPDPATNQPGGFWKPVVLEIHSA